MLPSSRFDQRLARRLRDILGEGALRLDDIDRERWGRDETEDLLFPPDAVALPESTEQVSAVLRLAHAEGIPVTPRGGGTGLSGGALPVRGGWVLSVERMRRVLDLDRDDLTMLVEAGVTTAEIHRTAEEAGLLYPPDPGSADLCCIGGNIAEDAAGPRSCKYGTTRRWVLGLQAVLIDGTVLELGGANRKDVTGYNLTQLLVGSEGTLAVVTRARLRLLPRPPATLAAAVPFADLETAAHAVVAIFRAGLDPVSCELLEARAVELVARLEPLPPEMARCGALLLVGLDGGSDEEVLAAAGGLDEIVRAAGAGQMWAATDEREQRRLWRARSRVGEAVKAHSTYKEIDAVVPRSHLARLVTLAREAAARHGIEAVCYGHAGDGNLHVNLLRGALPTEAWDRARDGAEDLLVEEVLGLGGAVSGEHGIGWTQRRHLARALGEECLALQRRVKAAFDPSGLLNPEKVLP